jgi:predicted Zn-dependent peptidase
MIKSTKLSNGLTVIRIPQQDTEAVTVMLLVPVGSRYETKNINGISHFLEHLMFKGTEHRPTTLDISKALDGVGAEYNAYTSKDHTLYYIKVAAQHLELALDLFSDMLFHSLFDADEIERERGVILEEINMYEDNPLMHLETLLEMCVFNAEHPLGYDIGGLKKNIKTLPRKAFMQFKERHYSPAKMHLCLAGHLDGKTDQLITKYFAEYQGPAEKKPYKAFKSNQKKPQFLNQYKATNQTQIGLGFVALPYNHPDLPALTLLSVILGGNMSSRLFISIRERQGLCYVIRTDVSPYIDTGIFSVQAGLDKNRLPQAVASITKELKLVKEQGVTAEELKNAKEYIKGQMALRFEDSSALATWYGRQSVLTEHLVSPAERIKQLNTITTADIQRIAQQLFKKEKFNLAAIGPQRSITGIAKLIDL